MARRRRTDSTKLVPGRVATPPDEMKLNSIQALRMSKLTGLDAKELAGQQIGELAERLRWDIDLELLLFRRVCGQVVKTDPVSGIKYPVPFATVHVLDRDCNFWGYFPAGWPYGWLYPIFCQEEELTTVVTDECGNFCVWIPRFDIDWILRWRRERFCFPDFFVRPSIADILRHLVEFEEPRFPRDPNPPDPPPIDIAAALASRGDVEALIGRPAQQLIAAAETSASFGAGSTALTEQLGALAFSKGLPPPLPDEVKQLHAEGGTEALAGHIGVEHERIAKLDLDVYHGPFIRCVDVLVPEWVEIFDVPDVSFRVTQDVDGDGDEDTIYEGAFDVPWGGPTPYVTLEASPIAVALPSPFCGPPVSCDQPAIERVGLMSVKSAPTYFNAATGFAVRPNKKHPGGLFASPAVSPSTAPFFGELQLYGCNHYPNAKYYRVKWAYAAGNGLPTPASFSPPVPFTSTWTLARWAPGFQQLAVSPDVNGWYDILPDADGWQPEHLLMDWVTGGDGVNQITLELGNAAKSVIHTVGPLLLVIDNNAPTAFFTPGVLGWRYGNSGPFSPLPLSCPLVQRTLTSEVQIRVGATVSAGHLRSVRVTAAGCGGVSPALVGAASTAEHWHTGPNDNTWSSVAVFSVSAGAPAGCYTFSIGADNRAFNPAGWDGGFAADWHYNSPWSPSTSPYISIAIVGP
jgi:hypothetical protein